MKALGLASGKMIPAAKFGQAADESEALELSEEEKEIEQNLKVSLTTSVGFNGIGLIEADCLPNLSITITH